MTSLRTRFADPVRRLTAMIVAIVLLVVIAIGVSLWRFGAASDSERQALTDSREQFTVQEARTAVATQNASVAGYARNQDPAELKRIAAAHRTVEGALAALHRSAVGDEEERAEVRRLGVIVDRLDQFFREEVVPVGGTPRFDSRLEQYAAMQAKLDARLEEYADEEQREALAGAASADDKVRDARIAAIVVGALAALVALGTALYCRRLIRDLFAQIDDGRDHVRRQMDEIDKIRATAGDLAQAAAEMRAAASQSASSTSEQSAAIAEAASTIEELNATASSIADSTRAGSTAAEQTGDTMRDMQEQVQAISERSLTLGERSQKIGEVVELINGISEQTNLLALNAAIEAARAGDAGRGFAVVASEVRKLAERSIRSTDSISEIIAAVQDETNATIMATEQGAKQAREVGELMRSTVDVMDESLRATDQQKLAAEQVSGAMVEIRTAAEQIAAEQQQRADAAERVNALVDDLEHKLIELSSVSSNGAAPAAAGNGAKAG